MKHIGNLLLIVLMLSLTMATGGCGAKFQLYALKVSPEVCLAGETVTISATLNYSGKADSEYVAELLVDEVVEQTQTLTVEPESARSILFTLTDNEPGTHIVQLGELTASLIVLEASNFNLSPSEVEIDQPVTVSADLRNIAGTEVTYHCDLLCQGESVTTKDVTLAGGSESEVTFTLSRSKPGMYEVKLGNLSGFFRVLKPAEIEVVSLDISPNPVKVGEETTIMLSIKNKGDIADTYTANMTVDGVAGGTEEVTLAGGAMETATFSLSKDLPGNYTIEMGGQEAILKVVEPVQLPTGVILADESFNGMHSLKINNETPLDTVIVLTSVEEPMVPLLALYIQSGDSYTFNKIPWGSYFLYVSFGDCWDNDSKKFVCTACYGRSTDEIIFEQWATVHRLWIFDLTADILAALTISDMGEDAFPDLG